MPRGPLLSGKLQASTASAWPASQKCSERNHYFYLPGCFIRRGEERIMWYVIMCRWVTGYITQLFAQAEEPSSWQPNFMCKSCTLNAWHIAPPRICILKVYEEAAYVRTILGEIFHHNGSWKIVHLKCQSNYITYTFVKCKRWCKWTGSCQISMFWFCQSSVFTPHWSEGFKISSPLFFPAHFRFQSSSSGGGGGCWASQHPPSFTHKFLIWLNTGRKKYQKARCGAQATVQPDPWQSS